MPWRNTDPFLIFMKMPTVPVGLESKTAHLWCWRGFWGPASCLKGTRVSMGPGNHTLDSQCMLLLPTQTAAL